MSTRKKIAIVMGGPSAEHEISLRSGREVLLHIDRSIYEPRSIVIDRARRFYCSPWDAGAPEVADVTHPGQSALLSGPFTACDCGAIWKDCDAAFLALHGAFGEDGIIQGYLESIGMRYTGSGVYASAVAMNKIAAKAIFERCGLTTPPQVLYGPDHPDTTITTIEQAIGFPCFVKCPQSGSSRLMGRAANRETLTSLLREFEPESDEIMIEPEIKGTEFSCAVLEKSDGSIDAFPPIEIRPLGSSFFDYEAKYSAGKSEEICPAPRESVVLDRIKQIAIRAHQAIDCKGLTRTDMILRNGEMFVLEINTLPGMTSASLAPQAFAAQGGTFAGLIHAIIGAALTGKK